MYEDPINLQGGRSIQIGWRKPDQFSLLVPLHKGPHNPGTLGEDRRELLEEGLRRIGYWKGGDKIQSHPCWLFSLFGPGGGDTEDQDHDLPTLAELTRHNLTSVRLPPRIPGG